MAVDDDFVVYTVAMGEYKRLPALDQLYGIRHICFTDDPKLEHDSWEIRLVEPEFKTDAARSSRAPKILAHRFLGEEFEESLYIDTRVQLSDNPRALWNYMTDFGAAPLGLAFLPSHETLALKFETMFRIKFEFEDRLNGQFLENLARNREFLSLPPVWGGIIARSHNQPELVSVMNTWWSQVCRFSRRDELVLPVLLEKLGDKCRRVDMNMFRSDFHVWPVGGEAKPLDYATELNVDSIHALYLAEQLHSRKRQFEISFLESQSQVAELRGEAAELRGEAAELRGKVCDLENELHQVREEKELVLASRTWKLRNAIRRFF